MGIKELSQGNLTTTVNPSFRNISGGYPSPYVENIVPIRSVTVGAGGTSSILFDNIPQTYKHLHLRASIRSSYDSGSNTLGTMYLRLNSDAGATKYAFSGMTVDGQAMYHELNYGLTTMYHNRSATLVGGLANVFGISIWDIFDYTNTSRWKTAQAMGGVAQNTNVAASEAWTKVISTWKDTAAITSILCFTDANFVQHSRVTLYGVIG